MKKLLPFVVLLASCGSSHKIVHTDSKRVDSTATTQRDTSYKTLQVRQADDLTAKDVDITVWYDTGRAYYPADSALAAALSRPVDRSAQGSTRKADQYVQLIQNAISASGRPAKIQIHIGEVSDSSSHTVRVDTGSAHQQAQVHVKTEEKKVDKDITHSGWPWYAWAGAGIIFLIIFLLILKRLGVI